MNNKKSRFLPKLSSAASNWLSSLKKMQEDNTAETEEKIDQSPKKRELIYLLSLIEEDGISLFNVELVLVSLLKNGGFGADKHFVSTKRSHKALMTENDLLIIHNLQVMEKISYSSKRHHVENQYVIKGSMAKDILALILKTKRCYWGKKWGPRLSIIESFKADFAWEFVGNGMQKLQCKVEDNINGIILPTRPLYYLDIDKSGENTAMLGLLLTDFDAETTAHFMDSPPLTHAEAQVLYETVNILPIPKKVNIEYKKGTPIPCLRLLANKKSAITDTALAIVNFKYDDISVDLENKNKIIDHYIADNSMLSIERDLLKEADFISVIREMQVIESARPKGLFFIGLPFVYDDLPTLREKNWIIDIADNFPFNCVEEDEWYTEIEDKTQYDWFGFELGILIEGKKINILPLLVKLISEHQDILNADQIQNLPDDHQFYLQLPDKRYMTVEAKRIKDILFVLVELYDNKLTNGKMKVGAFQAAQLLGLQQALNARWMGGDKLRKLGEKLIDFKGIQRCTVSKNLRGQLRGYQAEGRKILLFSSFSSMLMILEQELVNRKINYVMLTGQTKDRITPVNRFQEGDAAVMLISLKAGGVGLNLTAADVVIHYDPWWNPAAESQATDRAHRIGQTKPVFVYKLVCKGTVEEKIVQMQENKKQLSKGLFKAGEHKSTKMSAKDLEYLFEPLA